MEASSPPREVAVPARGLSELRRSLREEVGPLASVQALHAAGYAAGEDLYRGFIQSTADDVQSLGTDRFWRQLSRYFRQKGWGSLRHESPNPAVGLLRSDDWAEALADTESQPSCAFTSGLLSHFLTLAAGGPIAILEVDCVSRGGECCTFAFGSEAAIHELYGHLLEGTSMDEALARV
ncbi:MAG: 4-vinyl reductase [Gemmatimonadota bacterium]|jgi:predicted hydrocarbon binding protein